MADTIGIIDYGAGNIRSLENALHFLEQETEIFSHKLRMGTSIDHISHIIIPGVGSFRSGMEGLEKTKLIPWIERHAITRPLLGICLGMQLLAEKGVEGGYTRGLGLIPGSVSPLPEPHVGWDEWEGNYYYFTHHYAIKDAPWVIKQGNLWACQFHPEKSQEAGLTFLKEWLQL